MASAVTSRSRVRWLAPAGLIFISVVPVTAGALLVATLARGAHITPGNARFFASPVPVVVHIITASLYCVLGPFQFVSGFRRRRPGWHRAAGRLLIPCGLAAALAGLWMTLWYPLAPGDVELLRGVRLVFGWAMAVSLILGFTAIRRRDIARHRAWMIRGYAIAQGAGTQALIGIPWLLVTGKSAEGLSKVLLMTAAWMINITLAERIIRKRMTPRQLTAPPPGARYLPQQIREDQAASRDPSGRRMAARRG
jgi:uncharacterized membrane protein YozB (DUF420 family)